MMPDKWRLDPDISQTRIKEKICERIRELRVDRDIKQLVIAKYLGVNQNTYSQYENGRRGISPEMIVKLAQYYDVPSDYLMGLMRRKGVEQ